MSWRLVTDIAGEWGHLEPLLEKCFRGEFADFDLSDLKAFLTEGKMSLLVYDDKDKAYCLACVFELVDYPARRVFRIVALGGEGFGRAFPDWEAEVEDFARRLGCRELEAWCQDAQARLFRRWGMQKRFNVVRKEISHAG